MVGYSVSKAKRGGLCIRIDLNSQPPTLQHSSLFAKEFEISKLQSDAKLT